METKLTTTTGLNPFFVLGKEVKRIVFYDNGKEIASVRWFGSNNVYKSITLPFEVKRAVKVNLERKDAFYFKASAEYPLGAAYELYINSKLVGLEFLEEKKLEYWNETRISQLYSANFHGVREHYKKGEDGNVVREYIEDDYVERFESNYKHVPTEEAKKCKELADKLNKLSLNKLTDFDVHYILAEFDITPKKQ